MKCDEVQTLYGPYLDSELDAKTTLEIEQHLAVCPACARFLANEEKREARITSGLNRGQKTAALWQRIEREVAAASSASRVRPPARVAPPAGWHAVLATLGAQLRAGWQMSRRAWAGLAVVWMVILALNFTDREPDVSFAAGREMPAASEIRFALKQQQLLMAELAATFEPTPADKPKTARPGPRSDRRRENLSA